MVIYLVAGAALSAGAVSLVFHPHRQQEISLAMALVGIGVLTAELCK